MSLSSEIYQSLMTDNPSLASKVSVNDIKEAMKLNKPRLKKWIKNQKAKKVEPTPQN